MPPLPHNDTSDLDEERKKELIMEKKLRACRVNIISRVSDLPIRRKMKHLISPKYLFLISTANIRNPPCLECYLPAVTINVC